MKPLKWSKEIPTEANRPYWHRQGKMTPTIKWPYKHWQNGGLVVEVTGNYSGGLPVDHLFGEWAGPIPFPEEP